MVIEMTDSPPAPQPGVVAQHRARRWARALLRTPALLLHLFIGIPLTVIWFNPIGARLRWRGTGLDTWALRVWSRTMLRIFGIRRRVFGQRPQRPVLVVANHMSWVDIVVLHAEDKLGFVAKAEIRRWPLLGLLAAWAGTVFHARGSHDSANQVADRIAERLRQGGGVAIFPEGRVTDGRDIHRFHARLFRAAVDTGTPIRPAAIRYLLEGRRSTHIAFRERENFLQGFVRLLGAPPAVAELHWLEPVTVDDRSRSILAAEAEARVRRAYDSGSMTPVPPNE